MGNSKSKGAKDDTDTYKNGYPKKKLDDPEDDLNWAFYSNKIDPWGVGGGTVDQVHEKWWGNYHLLETKHNYIQWFFPIHEDSRFNGRAQALQRHEVRKIRKCPKATARFLKTYDLQLDFWGFVVVDRDTGRLERKKDDAEGRLSNLENHGHNFMRITRVLKCLGEMGFEHYKIHFLKALAIEIYEKKTLPSAKSGFEKYWEKTLVDLGDQYELAKFLAPYKAKDEAERSLKKSAWKYGGDATWPFKKGSRVEVLYLKKWYKGTFVDYNKWRKQPCKIQCDEDKKGNFTNCTLKCVRSIEPEKTKEEIEKDEKIKAEEEKKAEEEAKKKRDAWRSLVKKPRVTWCSDAERTRQTVLAQLMIRWTQQYDRSLSQLGDERLRLDPSTWMRSIFVDYIGQSWFLKSRCWIHFVDVTAGSGISVTVAKKKPHVVPKSADMWEFEDGMDRSGRWKEYKAKDAKALSAALVAKKADVSIKNIWGTYDVVLPTSPTAFGKQTNRRTGAVRRVRYTGVWPASYNATKTSCGGTHLQGVKVAVRWAFVDDGASKLAFQSTGPGLTAGENFRLKMRIPDWKKHMWVGLYKVGQADDVIDERARSIGKWTPKGKASAAHDDDDGEGEKKKKCTAPNDHSDDPIVEVVWDKRLGPWDASAKYEFRLFDAGWKHKTDTLLFVPSRGPIAVSPPFAVTGTVDVNEVAPEPKPRPEPKKENLASERLLHKPKWSSSRYSSSAGGSYAGSGLPGRSGVGREIKAGLYRNRTRVKVLCGKKWYEGVFKKSDFAAHPKQPYGILCDVDKSTGILAWSSLKTLEVIKEKKKDTTTTNRKRSLSDGDGDGGSPNDGKSTEKSGGTAWHIEI